MSPAKKEKPSRPKSTGQSAKKEPKTTWREEASNLGQHLFKYDLDKQARFADRLVDICYNAQGKDFLLIHNPGGWGTTRLKNCLQWERSIVEGVNDTIKKLGYSCYLLQYFRTGDGWREIMRDIREQLRFFATKSPVLASELQFITRQFNNINVVMVGVSQGAAFSNAVLQNEVALDRVYSIELGMPFLYESRQVATERTLAVKGNGLMPDALMEWDIITIIKTYFSAPFRWVKYRLEGRPTTFARCINVPGHDYNWEYPEVQRQVEDFLRINFGNNSSMEVGIS
ncbi:MAG: hypothetical protein JSW16_04230 [Dehalococcoidales bacterium]|nr:MAG: hypothetical protein JSW16_04230 [Dehalococcoidales bacterium]